MQITPYNCGLNSNTMGERPRTELMGALLELYETRDYADLTILTRDGEKHKVHQALICPRSQFFVDVVKQRKWHNNVIGDILLEEDDPEIIKLMIQYFYLLNYDPGDPRRISTVPQTPSDNSSDSVSVRTAAVEYGHVYGTSAVSAFGGPQSPFSGNNYRNRERSTSTLTVHALPGSHYGAFSAPPSGGGVGGRRRGSRGTSPAAPDPSPLAHAVPRLALHARMYAVGEKYKVHGLKALALDKFKIQLTRHWDSPEFAEAIHIVYNSTPSSDKEMREATADVLGWYPRLLDKPEIEVAVMDINGLAYELLKRSRRAEPEFMD